jgi:hypothetical protein
MTHFCGDHIKTAYIPGNIVLIGTWPGPYKTCNMDIKLGVLLYSQKLLNSISSAYLAIATFIGV